MNIPRLLAACALALLSGCAMFKSPSGSRATRNEREAQAAESRRDEFDRDAAIRDRASAYEKQGMSKSEALSAAQSQSTGKRTWP